MIKIVKLNNGFKVEGIDNVLYPDNGTLVFGPNTVILVTDESDMVTFRSASNFDVLFSGLIENITIDGENVTKDNIVEKFQAIANVDVSEQLSNYETIANHNADKALLEASIALKANSADLLTLFDSAEYNSQTKKIVFKHGDTVLVQIDATDFIKDGMVSNVEIVDNKLVISFNTDSGKENIEIPLSEIFNPNDYYTKAQIDTKEQNINASIALKANITDLNAETTARQDADTALQSNIDTKANAEDVYDKQTANSTFATQTVVNEEIAARIQRDTEIEQSLASKADKSNTYSKQEVDDAIANVDVSEQLSNYETIANHNADKALLEASIALKANSADLATVATSGSYNDLSNKPTIPTVPTNVSEFTNDAGYLTQDEVNVSEVVQKTDANDNYMSNTFVTTSNKVVTVGNAMSDSSKTHTFGYDKTYTDTEEQTVAKPFNQAKIQDWIDAGFVTEENITLDYRSGTAQPIPSYRLKVNIPSDIQARLVAEEKMTLAEVRFIKKSDNTELVVPVGNFSCDDIMVGGNAYWFKKGAGYIGETPQGDETPQVEEKETQYGFCVQFEGQYTGSTINFPQVNDGCMSNPPSEAVKNIQILFDGNIWNETFRIYNSNGYDEYSFVDFKFVGEMADTITETIINTKVNNYDEHPEKLNEYIRFANDIKAKILTDKNIDEVVDIEAKQDKLVSGTNIKTINGNSILGEGNIVIQGGGGEQQQADWNQTETTAVDYIKNKPTNVSAFANDAGYLTEHQSLADYYTKSEIDAMVGNINTILASI